MSAEHGSGGDNHIRSFGSSQYNDRTFEESRILKITLDSIVYGFSCAAGVAFAYVEAHILLYKGTNRFFRDVLGKD